MNNDKFTTASFLRAYLLPVLVTFLIPAFGLWFFNHVEASFDVKYRDHILGKIQEDKELEPERRERAIAFYESTPHSEMMVSKDPEVREIVQSYRPETRNNFMTFRWMKRISLICLLSGAVAFVAAGIGVICSFRSQDALYLSLRVSWNVLRWFAVIQVVGQGILVVALSFWITAFWMESYYVKLIFIAGLFALIAVGVLIAAIFRKLPQFNEFEGRLLPREEAPDLWARITQMAEKMGTAPPDNLFVGIDDNFFVTENTVKVGGIIYKGRTLYASISMLKTLSRAETEAVLAHELAHFSGSDTLFTQRISPLLGKYGYYLEALYGGLARPVFYFMFFFWNLYHLAINKLSREREFRADRLSAEISTAEEVARALVKTSAYSRYRHEVQSTLFRQDASVEQMDVCARIENGFPAFLASAKAGAELAESHTPHPFDSHPPLDKRIESLGLDPAAALRAPNEVPPVEYTWFSGIVGATEIESAQWKEFEGMFHQAHEEDLAWRYFPVGEAEIRHVEKYFPALEFADKKGKITRLDYEKVQVDGWEAPVEFSSVKKCQVQESMGRKWLEISAEERGKKKKHKISHADLKPVEGVAFLDAFEKYYRRHLISRAYLEEKEAEAKGATASG
jgi:Zn-dependent protease with chaperone function